MLCCCPDVAACAPMWVRLRHPQVTHTCPCAGAPDQAGDTNGVEQGGTRGLVCGCLRRVPVPGAECVGRASVCGVPLRVRLERSRCPVSVRSVPGALALLTSSWCVVALHPSESQRTAVGTWQCRRCTF